MVARRPWRDVTCPGAENQALRRQSAHAVYGVALRPQFALHGADPVRSASTDATPIDLFEVPSSSAPLLPHLPFAARDKAWWRYQQLPDGATYLRLRDTCEFLIAHDGKRIVCRSLDHANRESLHTYLLGPALSFALLAQGVESIHATAVVIEGEAVAFLADSGIGKSTLAASFLKAGHPVLTDDLMVLKPRGARFLAQPGWPRLKLFPKTAARLGLRLPLLAALNQRTRKSIMLLGAGDYQNRPVPLRAIYVLRPPRSGSRSVAIRRLSARRAFLSLLQGTFNARVRHAERLKRHFQFAGQVAARVPIKTLSYPRDLRLLPRVREAVLSDLAKETSSR